MPNSNSETSDGRLQAAQERVQAARNFREQSDKFANEVIPKANGAIESSKIRLQASASKGARSKIPELLAEHTITTIGAWSYVLVCGIGLAYSLGFYQRIDGVRILNYFDTADFLLSAFGNPFVPIIGAVVGVLSIVTLVIRYYRRSIQLANFHWTAKWETTVRRKNNLADIALLATVVLVVFGIPYLSGKFESLKALNDKSRLVRLSLLQESDKPQTRIPKAHYTILLGTTSNFHILYECETKLGAERGMSCESWKPFVVPRTNVASLAFDLNEADSEVEPSSLAEAIANLTTAITELERTQIIEVDPAPFTDAINKLEEAIRIKELEATVNVDRIKVQTPDHGLSPAISNIGAALVRLNSTVSSLGGTDNGEPCVARFDKLGSVGPFFVGEHTANEQNADILKAIIDQLNSTLERSMPIHLLLIGRVDVTPFAEDRKEIYYGSHLGLAQSRAEWVRSELLDRATGDDYRNVLGRALVLGAGPTNVGETLTTPIERMTEASMSGDVDKNPCKLLERLTRPIPP